MVSRSNLPLSRRLGSGRLIAAAVLCALGLSLAGPVPAALAASSGASPFSPGVPQSTVGNSGATSTAVPITSTSAPGDSGISPADAVGIGIGALVLIVGIGYFIWRDARRRAPVRTRAQMAALEGTGRSGSKRPPQKRKLSAQERRRRKRGKAR
jgi:hypothetical protein